MKTTLDYGSRFFVLFLLAVTVYATIFNGDVGALKNQLLDRAPGLATSMSVMLPTSKVAATRVIGDTVKLRTPRPITLTSNGEIIDDGVLPDCATVATTVPCQLIATASVPTAVPSPTPLPGARPAPWIDPELADATPVVIEPVRETVPLPISNVLSSTADYRSDCHAMFASKEDKSSWAADIAACQATGDYK